MKLDLPATALAVAFEIELPNDDKPLLIELLNELNLLETQSIALPKGAVIKSNTPLNTEPTALTTLDAMLTIEFSVVDIKLRIELNELTILS